MPDVDIIPDGFGSGDDPDALFFAKPLSKKRRQRERDVEEIAESAERQRREAQNELATLREAYHRDIDNSYAQRQRIWRLEETIATLALRQNELEAEKKAAETKEAPGIPVRPIPLVRHKQEENVSKPRPWWIRLLVWMGVIDYKD